MKKLKTKLLLLLSVLILTSFQQIPTPTYVYICTGPNSECYHKINTCRGLNKCSTEIKKITKDDAVNKYKRRACKICYK